MLRRSLEVMSEDLDFPVVEPRSKKPGAAGGKSIDGAKKVPEV